METDQSFSKRCAELDAQCMELDKKCDKLKKQKTILMEVRMEELNSNLMEEKKKLADLVNIMKNKCGEMEAKLTEEKEKCKADLEDRAAIITKLEEENMKVGGYNTELLIKNDGLKRQKRQAEEDLKEQMAKEAKNNDLLKKEYDNLLAARRAVDEEMCRLQKSELDEKEKLCKLNHLLEVEKKRVAELEGEIGDLETEKVRSGEVEGMFLNTWKKIEALEKAKKNKHAEDAELIKEKGNEIRTLSIEKRTVEAQMRAYEERMKKKVVGLENNINTLMDEKMEKDKMISDRAEAIKNLMEEKMDKEKMISDSQEAIKALDRENEALLARNKELEAELKTVKNRIGWF